MKVQLEESERVIWECEVSINRDLSRGFALGKAERWVIVGEGYEGKTGYFFFFLKRGDTRACQYAAENNPFAIKKINIAW